MALPTHSNMQWPPKAKMVFANAEKTSAGLPGGCLAASALRPCLRLTEAMYTAVKDVVKRVNRENRRMFLMLGIRTVRERTAPVTKAQVLWQQGNITVGVIESSSIGHNSDDIKLDNQARRG